MTTSKALTRFLKSTSVGVSTFLFDLLLLFIFIDVFAIHHVLAAGIAFLIAVSINYLISRRFVFPGSERSAATTYVFFLGIAGMGFLLVTSLMYLCVDILGLHYVVSRVVIAAVVGCWNYFLNLYWNFKVAGT